MKNWRYRNEICQDDVIAHPKPQWHMKILHQKSEMVDGS